MGEIKAWPTPQRACPGGALCSTTPTAGHGRKFVVPGLYGGSEWLRVRDLVGRAGLARRKPVAGDVAPRPVEYQCAGQKPIKCFYRASYSCIRARHAVRVAACAACDMVVAASIVGFRAGGGVLTPVRQDRPQTDDPASAGASAPVKRGQSVPETIIIPSSAPGSC